MRKIILACAGFAVLGVAPVLAQPAGVRDFMIKVLQPASNLVFEVQAETDPEIAEKVDPNYGRWNEAARASEELRAAADQLKRMAPAGDPGDWAKLSDDMAGKAEALAVSARAKDGAGFSKAAGELLEVCSACHERYPPVVPSS